MTFPLRHTTCVCVVVAGWLTAAADLKMSDLLCLARFFFCSLVPTAC